jgi:hypothetical protein
VFHRAPTVDQHSDLPTNLRADLAQVSREFVAEDLVCGNPAPEEALDLTDLARLETVGVAVDLDEWTSRPGSSSPVRTY